MAIPLQRLFLLGFVVFTWLFLLQQKKSSNPLRESGGDSRVYNESLGFGRIYCVNLPHRTDRRDAMQLISIMSGITVEFIDGVYGEKIDNRAIVGHPDRNMPEGEKNGVWGCWRSHLNALSAFLDSGLETALILEDDANWDIHLKDTLSITAEKIREMESERLHTVINDPERPYGDTWDTLYLGSCFEFDPEDHKSWPHRIYDDPTVPDREEQSYHFPELLAGYSMKETGQRLVQKSRHSICLFGYAVTRIGAIQLLYQLGQLSLQGPIDVQMGLLQDAGSIKGYTVAPPLFMEWKSGEVSRDSDTSPGARSGNYNIKNGVRQNLAGWIEEQRRTKHGKTIQ